MLSTYKRLYNKFQEQGWWPVLNQNNILVYNRNFKDVKKTPAQKLEICVGAILTQNTSWKNVELALKNLSKQKLISVKKLDKILEKKLAALIKPSGYYNQKARTIKNFIKFAKNYKNINHMFGDRNIRNKLLKIKGIGPETADSILLYADNKPYFVVDAYTMRIFTRLGKAKTGSYGMLQQTFHKKLKNDYKLFNEYHALIVRLAKENCKKIPSCMDCCLKNSCKFTSKK